jgi:hypothetical protein
MAHSGEVAVAGAKHPASEARLQIERDIIQAMQKPGLVYWRSRSTRESASADS